jgi:hypothetical protein
VFLGLGFLVAGYFVPADALTDDGFPLNNFLYFMGACFTLPSLLITIGILFFSGRQKKKVEDLLATGTQGTAMILGLEDTGMLINDNPRVKISLEVTISGYMPYRVQKTLTIPQINLAQVQPGQQIGVIADPTQQDDPDKVGLLLR